MPFGPLNPEQKIVSPNTENRKLYLTTPATPFIVPPNVYTLFVTAGAGGAGGGAGGQTYHTPAYVQHVAAGSAGANVNSITLTWGTAPTNGNTLLLVATTGSGSDAITSISQTGVTWTKDLDAVAGNSFWRGVVGSGAGTVTTVNLNNTYIVAVAREFTNIDTSSPVDVHASSSPGSSTTVDSGTTSTTTVPNEVWLCIFDWGFNNVSSTNPTNSFTDFISNYVYSANPLYEQQGTAYKIVSSTSTANTSITLSGASGNFANGAIITYKASSSGTQPGGGGGSGSYTNKYPISVTPGQSLQPTIGAGGTSGNNGGTTSLGSVFSLGGGTAGVAGSSSAGAGGAAGTVSTGGGFSGSAGSAGSGTTGGNGGASPLGALGSGGTNGVNGSNAVTYVAGGGGAGAGVSTTGGTGGAGYLLIEW